MINKSESRKNVFFKRAAALIVAVLVMLLASASVYANDDPPAEPPADPPAADMTVSFDKYLVMNSSAIVPDISFEYTITAAEDGDIPSGAAGVLPGISPGAIAITGASADDITDVLTTDGKFLVNFDDGDTTVDYEHQADTDYVKGLEAGEKYAKKTVTLDFANVTFTEPGIYRYKITETTNNSSDSRLTYDADNTRYLDVYVTNSEDPDHPDDLVVGPYVLHATDAVVTNKDDANIGHAASDYKSQGFTNEYVSYMLILRKNVAGNQASKDKYFEFTVKLENVDPGTVLTLDYTNASPSIQQNPNDATTITFDIPAPAETPAGGESQDPPAGEEPADPSESGEEPGADVQTYTQPAEITVPEPEENEEPSVTQKLYLHHGQYIVIRGIPAGAKIMVTEAPEEYGPNVEISDKIKADSSIDDTGALYLNTANVTEASVQKETADGTHTVTLTKKAVETEAVYTNVYSDAIIIYTNSKSGSIPTGVILSVAAPAIIGIIVICAIVFLVNRSRKRRSEIENVQKADAE